MSLAISTSSYSATGRRNWGSKINHCSSNLNPNSSVHLVSNKKRKNFPCLAAALATGTQSPELQIEEKKHELLRAVQETQRGLVTTPDQRSTIEEILVNLEGCNSGSRIDLAVLDGTWRLQYTSARDVLVLFEAASRLPFFEVGQIYQKFECRDRSDGGVIRNVVQWSIPSLLEISVQNIKISEQLQAVITPAILPRTFLSLQILQFIQQFKAQIPVTTPDPGRRSAGGLYYLSYLDKNMLLGRSIGGGGVFVFTKAQPLYF
ncbi:Probable plastid-lipid-associated protein 10, chloroplastic [Linum perenne]